LTVLWDCVYQLLRGDLSIRPAGDRMLRLDDNSVALDSERHVTVEDLVG
jgi:hypothetical protein